MNDPWGSVDQHLSGNVSSKTLQSSTIVLLSSFSAGYHLASFRLNRLQDTGVKAIVSGLVSASSRVLLSSSHGASGSNKCQKLNSKYINMIVEWRTDVYRGDEDSVVALFPGRVSYFYLCVGFVVALTLLAKGYASFGLARRRRRTSKRVLRRAGSVQSVS